MRIPAAFTTKAGVTETRKGAVDDGASGPTPSFQHGAGERVKHSLNLDRPIPREVLLRLPEVVRLTGLSETVIYERMSVGTFPLAKQVGPRTIAWPAARVLDWIEALPDWKPSGEPAVKRKKTPNVVARRT